MSEREMHDNFGRPIDSKGNTRDQYEAWRPTTEPLPLSVIEAGLKADREAWAKSQSLSERLGYVYRAMRQADPDWVEMREAAQEILDQRMSSYSGRGGRCLSVQDESGEMCWIVPHEPVAALERALVRTANEPASGAHEVKPTEKNNGSS
jgi:hypothetical protein